MAKLPVFTRQTAPSSSAEYLAKLDELLRRNKGGSTLQGYDTNSSYTPQNLGGNVVDPTGMGQTAATASQTVPQINQTLPNPGQDVPNFGNMNVNELLNYATTADISKLTPEQLTNLFDTVDFQNNNIQQNLNAPIANPNYVDPSISSPAISTPSKYDPSKPYSPVSKPPIYPIQSTPNGGTRFSDGSTSNKQIDYPSPTLDFNQYAQSNNNQLNNADQILNAPERDFTQNPPTPGEISASGARGLARTHAQNLGITEDQLNANNAWAPAPYIAPPKQNPIRLAIGNALETAGGAIPGLGEHGISEWIAGGPTKNSGQVQAADNTQISEPDPNMPMQPGAGIDALKGQFQSAQSSMRGMMEKPPMEQISGMNRQVGNVVGQTAAAASQMKAPGNEQSFNTPPMSAPAMSAPVQSYTQPQSQSQTYSQPQSNNQPSQNNNQPSQNNSPSQPQPAPRPTPQPVATPTKYIPPKQPIQIPLATYGVGSAQPAPSPAPAPQSQPSSNIFSKISSLISNLFRRK